MQLPNHPRPRTARGFTLPAILVVVGALLILAVGALLIVGIERNTSRAFSDRERANLAARAGLEDVKGIFAKEASNDDFLILQGQETKATGAAKDPAPYLYLARGSGGGDNVSYRYIPLFSAATVPSPPAAGSPIEAPAGKDLIGSLTKDVSALPWHEPAKVSWIEVQNSKNKVVSRYAYWVEDLQGRVDASTAGNVKDAGAHKRYGWNAEDTSKFAKFPAPGLNAEDSKPGPNGIDAEPPLDQVALYVLDPTVGAKDDSTLDKTIIEGRKALISPDSVLAVSGITPPLARGADGRLTKIEARALEENLTASVQPYDEQPVVPFANGIDPAATGKPKLNLNALLAQAEQAPDTAVDKMADWMNKGLPKFKDRKGGFPEDYVKTIAANAIGYASPDNKTVVQMGSYRGLGASPMISEIVLDVNYLGTITSKGSKVMQYEFILFAELFNHTNLEVEGEAALSYEVGYNLPKVGAAPEGERFDHPSVVSMSSQTPILTLQGDRYWTKPVNVSLQPGEYKFYRFVKVNYAINVGSNVGAQFTLVEPIGSAGLSMKWNDQEVERIPSIIRASTGMTFHASYKKYFGKAAIPGHSYGPYGEFINNMGDPRIAHFIRYQSPQPPSSKAGVPLGENAFPENISPNRRNIRYSSIYVPDGGTKLKTYGRVTPSEWPDGGHDPEVTPWDSGWNSQRQGYEGKYRPDGSVEKSPVSGTGPAFDPTPAVFPVAKLPEPGEAPTYLSNRGRYYSATELGRLYDPILFLPTFDPASGLSSDLLRGAGEPIDERGKMSKAGASWPLVQANNAQSPYFGGGNTLRIGRPEHPKFDQPAKHAPADMPGDHAARLLDLFHAGKSRSAVAADREGPVVRIDGHVNLNTASRDALRAMAAGYLQMDPKLSKRTSDVYDSRMAPAVEPLTTLSAPTTSVEADKLADAIIDGRPFTSPAELACVVDSDGKQVFGNTELYPEKDKIQWSDAAAEEIFGRVYEASTVRSRNFRVWVVGQAVAPTQANNPSPEVLSEVRRTFTIFADPGERTSDGTIDPIKSRVTILHENDF